ncbi:MAG: hypothetical protein ABIQ12_10775 [Opitutaceae bacterium]
MTGLLIGGPAAAVETLSPSEQVRERILRMTEFFDTMLPGVLGRNNITVHVQPKFSDLRDSEFIRVPFELRYGLTDEWELTGGLVPFVPNPLNGGVEHRWGPGELKFGFRRDIGRTFAFFDETTVGLEMRVPVGRPPSDLNDHYTHVKPFASASRTLRTWPSTNIYANLAYDRSVDLTHRAAPPDEVVRRNITEITQGLLYKPGQFGYFAEYRFSHLHEDDGVRLGHQTRVGSIWDVPLARTAKWGLPGKWQLDLALRAAKEEGRDRDLGISARVKWRTTLREVLQPAKTSKAK